MSLDPSHNLWELRLLTRGIDEIETMLVSEDKFKLLFIQTVPEIMALL